MIHLGGRGVPTGASLCSTPFEQLEPVLTDHDDTSDVDCPDCQDVIAGWVVDAVMSTCPLCDAHPLQMHHRRLFSELVCRSCGYRHIKR